MRLCILEKERIGMETGEGWGESSVTAVLVFKFENLNLILQKVHKKAVAHSCHFYTGEIEAEGSLVLAG